MVVSIPSAWAAATRAAIGSTSGGIAVSAAGGCVGAGGASVAAGVQAASSIRTAIRAGRALFHWTLISSSVDWIGVSCPFPHPAAFRVSSSIGAGSSWVELRDKGLVGYRAGSPPGGGYERDRPFGSPSGRALASLSRLREWGADRDCG